MHLSLPICKNQNTNTPTVIWSRDAKHLLPGSSDPSLRGHSPNNPGHLVNLENSRSIENCDLKQSLVLTAVETSQMGKSKSDIIFALTQVDFK